jgi:hypothetical protein
MLERCFRPVRRDIEKFDDFSSEIVILGEGIRNPFSDSPEASTIRLYSLDRVSVILDPETKQYRMLTKIYSDIKRSVVHLKHYFYKRVSHQPRPTRVGGKKNGSGRRKKTYEIIVYLCM